MPHIFASSDVLAFKAFGYAQAAAHGNLVLKLYGEARGRASEYWGENNLRTDRFVRTMGIPARAERWYQQISPAYRANLDAFAAGFNQYAAQHGDQIADSVKVVLPVTAQDVLAHGQRIINFLFTPAAQETRKAFGALDVPYGDVMRLRYGHHDLPGNGAAGDPFGVFRVASYVPDQDGKYTNVGGDTYYQAVEFSKPVRAKVLTAYGNSTQPNSKHIGDQLELFSKKAMRDAWRTRQDIEAHLELREEIK